MSALCRLTTVLAQLQPLKRPVPWRNLSPNWKNNYNVINLKQERNARHYDCDPATINTINGSNYSKTNHSCFYLSSFWFSASYVPSNKKTCRSLAQITLLYPKTMASAKCYFIVAFYKHTCWIYIFNGMTSIRQLIWHIKMAWYFFLICYIK